MIKLKDLLNEVGMGPTSNKDEETITIKHKTSEKEILDKTGDVEVPGTDGKTIQDLYIKPFPLKLKLKLIVGGIIFILILIILIIVLLIKKKK